MNDFEDVNDFEEGVLGHPDLAKPSGEEGIQILQKCEGGEKWYIFSILKCPIKKKKIE